MNQCSECLFWCEVEGEDYGECFEIKQPTLAENGSPLEESIAGLPLSKSPEGVIFLRTKSTFGCVLWVTEKG